MKIYTVSQINNFVKEYIENEASFKSICVEGEASNITYQEKHMYITLKENTSRIKCAGFSYKYKRIPLDIKEGDKLKVYGKINVYSVDASVQIIADSIEKSNDTGNLFKKLEELKLEYLNKGYFSENIKKTLPYNPRTIGIVTSDTGDAVRDIIRNTKNQDDKVDIYLYPAKVQGDGSAISVAKGIEFFNKNIELGVECIIIGRGGGSIEDLWAFNEREVIEAVYNSSIPIISAVGHEPDLLLSDLVADKRASTPTQAPLLIIKNRKDEERNLNDLKYKVGKLLNQKLEFSYDKLENIKNSYQIRNFIDLVINSRQQYLDQKKSEINKLRNSIFSTKDKRENLKTKLEKINMLILRKIEIEKLKLQQLETKFEKHDINKLFERGFTITYANGKILKDTNVRKGTELRTVFKDKSIISEVK